MNRQGKKNRQLDNEKDVLAGENFRATQEGRRGNQGAGGKRSESEKGMSGSHGKTNR